MDRLRFPISAKIAVAFGAILLIVLAVGVMAMVRLSAIDQQAIAARDDWLPSARALGQLRTSVRQYRLAEATLALAHDERERAAATLQLHAAAAAVDQARVNCEPFITPGSDSVHYMREFDTIWAGYQAATAGPLRSFLSRTADARDYFAVGAPYYETAAGTMTRGIIDNTRTGIAGAAAAVQFVRLTRELILAALLAVIATSAILGLLLTRSVSIPVRVTTAAMRRLASRDFAVTIPGIGRRDELGEMAHAIEVFRQSLIDSEQSRAREDAQNVALRGSEQRFRAVFDCVHDAIFISDAANGRILDVNPRGCEMFGFERHELIGGTPNMLSAGVAPYTDTAVTRGIVRIRGEAGPTTCEWQCKAKDGRLLWVEMSLRQTNFAGHDVVLTSVRDISDRREAEKQIRHMARYDGLTGLPNRGVFVEAVARALASAKRASRQFAVLFLDLDHFKDVNDTLGHPAGDALLRAVAARLRGAIRESDVVARFGGDEFALLADVSEAADAAQLAAKLLKAFEAPFAIEGTQIRSGCSIGIALYAPDTADVETLMSHADVALYRAKSDGRGTFRFFSNAMDSETRARVTLISELREAIVSDQLFLVYQPQVEIGSGRITGLEALVRWRHPQRGVLAPDAFIPAAESSGLIVALGKWVLRDACQQAKRWYDAGLLPRRLAVNLSAAQLRVPIELEQLVTATLTETGLPAERLEIELTESMLMGTGAHQELLARLRARGVKVAIDDFGTGYSCLDYLRRFPVDRIKIAQSFVSNLDHPGNAAVVKATIGLARELHIAVIAEGLEKPRQIELLSAWGCAEAQGFYYAQPATPAQLEPLLRAGVIRHAAGDEGRRVAA